MPIDFDFDFKSIFRWFCWFYILKESNQYDKFDFGDKNVYVYVVCAVLNQDSVW